jgi:uncharacterized protein with NAD-binding domain and iron-sulfur cluster
MKKMIFIGAGIAGLSTGCYAQMNGYDSEICEMHNIAGGEVVKWTSTDKVRRGVPSISPGQLKNNISTLYL